MDFNNDDGTLSNVSIISTTTGSVTINGVGGILLPAGSVVDRPPFVNGIIRNNTETGFVEVSSDGSWVNVTNAGSLPTGGVANDVLIKNSNIDGDASFGPIVPAMAPDLAVDANVVHIDGDSMTGSLSLPNTKGEGLLIDNGYSWWDIVGAINPKTLGATAAAFKPFRGQVNSWAHYAGSYGDIIFHLPHDYAPGTNLFFHVHWGHNGTSIEGNFIIKCWASYASRTYPATPFSAPIETAIAVSSANINDYPQYVHSVIEIQLSTVGGAINMLNTTDIETDGLILVRYEIDTIPSIGGSTIDNVPYIQTFDVHYQSTSIGTKNKDPNFWA